MTNWCWKTVHVVLRYQQKYFRVKFWLIWVTELFDLNLTSLYYNSYFQIITISCLLTFGLLVIVLDCECKSTCYIRTTVSANSTIRHIGYYLTHNYVLLQQSIDSFLTFLGHLPSNSDQVGVKRKLFSQSFLCVLFHF